MKTLRKIVVVAATAALAAAAMAPAAYASYRVIGSRGGFLTADGGGECAAPNGELASICDAWLGGDAGGAMDPNG